MIKLSAHLPKQWLGRAGVLRAIFVVGCVLPTVLPSSDLNGLDGRPDPARVFSIRDAVELKQFRGTPFAALSSDGRWLAYVVDDAELKPWSGGVVTATGAPLNGSTGADLLVTDLKSGVTKNVSSGHGVNWCPTWSPDGRLLAFGSDRDGVAHTWLWDRETGLSRRASEVILYGFWGRAIQWTRDGRSLVAEVLPEGMSLDQVIEGAEHLPLSKGSAAMPGPGVLVYRTSRAQDNLLRGTFLSNRDLEGNDSVVADPTGLPTARTQLASIDVLSGHQTYLGAASNIHWSEPSPDGQLLAYVSEVGAARGTANQSLGEITLLRFNGGPSRIVAHGILMHVGCLAWSPDSKKVAYLTSGTLATGDVYVIDVNRGTQRRLSKSHPSLTIYGQVCLLWSPNGDALYFQANHRLWSVSTSSDRMNDITPNDRNLETEAIVPSAQDGIWSSDGGRSLTVIARDDTGTEGFYKVEIATHRARSLRKESSDYRDDAIVSANGSVLAWVAQDARHPADAWISDAGFHRVRQVTHLNPGLSDVQLGDQRVIEFLDANGKTLHGTLLLPVNYQAGQRVPLIVNTYPGSTNTADSVNVFGLIDSAWAFKNMQVLAARGYAVLYADQPQRVGMPVRDLVDEINAAVDAVVAVGIADPNALGIWGQSYGGYATLAMISKSARFKAAVMVSGFGNLMSMYGSMGQNGNSWQQGYLELEGGRMGGTPWQYRDRYIDNSPVFHLNHVDTPLLIVHGALDENVPPWLADEVFVDMRRLDKEVEYRKYVSEHHGILGKEDTMDYWTATARWFDGHVKNADHLP